ncbi:MAG: MFS transporter, partial [Pontibacterium sp.]
MSMTSSAHTSPSSHQPYLSFVEFILLLATVNCLIALSIDAMLPALAIIGMDLGAAHINDSQLIISMVFAGVAIGQLFYGSIADAFGRKPTLMLGLSL